MSRATEDKLAQLHDQVADAILDRVKAEDVTAADLNAAIKFLKDNGITCEPGTSPKLDRIIDALPDSIEGEDAWQ